MSAKWEKNILPDAFVAYREQKDSAENRLYPLIIYNNSSLFLLLFGNFR